MSTLDKYASEALKQKYLPKLANWELRGGWALTEIDNGSDASSIISNVTYDNNGNWILNGNKRWPGNCKDLMVVFAKNNHTKEINAFLVHLNWSGISTSPINHKMA